MNVLERDLIKVKIADLIFDPDNPNEMTPDQMDGLRESMRRFGYLTPVIIDQNNKIADGEHRALIYKEFGMQEIPAYKVNLQNDTDRRLLRQTMNKLKGQHNVEKDLRELELLASDQGNAEALKALLKIDENTINEMKFILSGNEAQDTEKRIQDKDPAAYFANSYLNGNIKQIVLYFNNLEYTNIMQKINKIMQDENIDNHTELFVKAFDYYASNRNYA